MSTFGSQIIFQSTKIAGSGNSSDFCQISHCNLTKKSDCILPFGLRKLQGTETAFGSRHVYRNIKENSILFHRIGNMNWICSQFHIVFWGKKPCVYKLPVYKNNGKRKYGPMQCISCIGFRHVYHNILENSILFHRMGNMNWICSHKQSINAFWALLKLGPGQTNSWGHRGY